MATENTSPSSDPGLGFVRILETWTKPTHYIELLVAEFRAKRFSTQQLAPPGPHRVQAAGFHPADTPPLPAGGGRSEVRNAQPTIVDWIWGDRICHRLFSEMAESISRNSDSEAHHSWLGFFTRLPCCGPDRSLISSIALHSDMGPGKFSGATTTRAPGHALEGASPWGLRAARLSGSLGLSASAAGGNDMCFSEAAT